MATLYAAFLTVAVLARRGFFFREELQDDDSDESLNDDSDESLNDDSDESCEELDDKWFSVWYTGPSHFKIPVRVSTSYAKS